MNNNECANCQTRHDWYLLTEYVTPEGVTLMLCDDCMEEELKIEALADQLAAMPSCEKRQQLIDNATTTAGLVNALKAHDLAQCVYCASTRKTVSSDRLYVNAAAVCCEGRTA